MTLNLQNIPTCKLVKELASRDTVKEYFVEPNQAFLIQVDQKKVNCFDSGPIVILQVFD